MKILLLFFLTFSSSVKAEVNFLTTDTLYSNPIANPRTPMFSLFVSNTNNRADVRAALGKSFGLINWDDTLQLGIEAGTWSTLAHKKESAFNLISDDYIISIPIMFSFVAGQTKISGALKYNHISAHLGDGAKTIIDDIKDTVYSREFISTYLNLQLEELTLHFLLGYSLVVIPESLGRYFIGGGWQIHIDYFLFANNLTWNDDVESLDISMFVGLCSKNKNLESGLGLMAYFGSDRRGRLFDKRDDRLSLGVFFK